MSYELETPFRSLYDAALQAWVPRGKYHVIKALAGGKSGAPVLQVDIVPESFSSGDLQSGQYILKLQEHRVWDGQEEPTEQERHELAQRANAEFASRHIPPLVRNYRLEQQIALLYGIAGESLDDYQTAYGTENARVLREVGHQVLYDLMANWNRHTQVVHEFSPRKLLSEWLGYRLNPAKAAGLHTLIAEATKGRPAFRIAHESVINPLWLCSCEEVAADASGEVALVGLIHGDFHPGNLLLHRERPLDYPYWVIDFALARAAPLGYDHAYFELALVLRHFQSGNASRLFTALRAIDAAVGSEQVHDVPPQDAGLVECVRALREAGERGRGHSEHGAGRAGSFGRQMALARVAAALNWVNKPPGEVDHRPLALAYGAWAARGYLAKYHQMLWNRLGDETDPVGSVTAPAADASVRPSGKVQGQAKAATNPSASRPPFGMELNVGDIIVARIEVDEVHKNFGKEKCAKFISDLMTAVEYLYSEPEPLSITAGSVIIELKMYKVDYIRLVEAWHNSKLDHLKIINISSAADSILFPSAADQGETLPEQQPQYDRQPRIGPPSSHRQQSERRSRRAEILPQQPEAEESEVGQPGDAPGRRRSIRDAWPRLFPLRPPDDGPGRKVGPRFGVVEKLAVAAMIMVLGLLALPALQAGREKARRAQCVTNLKQLALAAHNYIAAHNVLPQGIQYQYDPRSGSSWTTGSCFVALLPHLEQEQVYNAVNFNLNIYNAANTTISGIGIAALWCPSDPTVSDSVLFPAGTAALDNVPLPMRYTSYAANAGTWCNQVDKNNHNGVLYLSSRVGYPDITDGLSNTMLFGERAHGKLPDGRNGQPNDQQSWGWWTAGNYGDTLFITWFPPNPFDKVPRLAYVDNSGCQAAQGLGPGQFDGAANGWVITPSSFHPGGANFIFCDASVHFLKDSISCWQNNMTNGSFPDGVIRNSPSAPSGAWDYQVQPSARFGNFQRLSTRNGGEVISADDY